MCKGGSQDRLQLLAQVLEPRDHTYSLPKGTLWPCLLFWTSCQKGSPSPPFPSQKGSRGVCFFFFFIPLAQRDGWLGQMGWPISHLGWGPSPQSRREMVNGFNAIPRDQATLAAARQAAAAAPAAATATPLPKGAGFLPATAGSWAAKSSRLGVAANHSPKKPRVEEEDKKSLAKRDDDKN